MRALSALLLSLFALVAAPRSMGAESTQRLIAVLEPKGEVSGPPAERARLSEAVRDELQRALAKAKVMSRDEMQEIASANPELLDRCDDDDCQALGKLLGADWVVQEIFTRRGPKLSLKLRLLETSTGRTLGTKYALARSPARLVSASRHAAQALVKPLDR